MALALNEWVRCYSAVARPPLIYSCLTHTQGTLDLQGKLDATKCYFAGQQSLKITTHFWWQGRGRRPLPTGRLPLPTGQLPLSVLFIYLLSAALQLPPLAASFAQALQNNYNPSLCDNHHDVYSLVLGWYFRNVTMIKKAVENPHCPF